jgi:hypothetical protein
MVYAYTGQEHMVWFKTSSAKTAPNENHLYNQTEKCLLRGRQEMFDLGHASVCSLFFRRQRRLCRAVTLTPA